MFLFATPYHSNNATNESIRHENHPDLPVETNDDGGPTRTTMTVQQPTKTLKYSVTTNEQTTDKVPRQQVDV